MNTYKQSERFLMAGHWHVFGIYFNREDPRIIVPKRVRTMGWTLNMARPMAIPLLLVIAAFTVAPFKALEYYQIKSGSAYVLVFLGILVALVSFCSWMANPSRLEKRQK